MNKNIILRNKNYLIIIIACLLLLAPILFVGSYDRPFADDYDYSILTHEVVENGGNVIDIIKAAIKTDLNFYNNWQGLYSSAFILSLQPAIFGETFYSLTCFIVLAIAFLCLCLSMRILNKHFINQSNIFIFTSTILILTILALLLPSATQGLYWYNGAMNYMPWAFTNFLGICILIELFFTEKKTMKFYSLLIFSILLSFFTSGGNHVTAFANILFMIFATVFLIFKKKRFYSILPLLFAIIGFVIMYLAPGTAARQMAIQQLGFHAPSIGETIISSFKEVKISISAWLNFKWFLSLILLTPLFFEISKNIKHKITIKCPILSIIFSLIVIGGMFAVPYYAMGTFGKPRLTNVVWITFIILSWINYTLILGFLENKHVITFDLDGEDFKKMFVVIALISLFLVFYLPQDDVCSNSYVCLHELHSGVAKKFSIEMDDRIKYIKSTNETEIKLKPITPGSVLYFYDIRDDPEEWPNTSMEKYFNKKSISIY